MKQTIQRTVGLDNWARDACKVRRSHPAGISPKLIEKIEHLFASWVVMTEYPVADSDGLGSAIIESKDIDGCGGPRSVRIIVEGERGGMKKSARSNTVA